MLLCSTRIPFQCRLSHIIHGFSSWQALFADASFQKLLLELRPRGPLKIQASKSLSPMIDAIGMNVLEITSVPSSLKRTSCINLLHVYIHQREVQRVVYTVSGLSIIHD